MSKLYRIGELARLCGVQVETVRYYEAQKLMPKPGRSQGNYRQYSQTHLERLSFIRHCRSLDMPMEEIRQLLRAKENPGFDCGEVNAVLDRHIAHVAERLTELRRLQKQLVELRTRCGQGATAEECGILASLSSHSAPDRRGSAGMHGVRRARGADDSVLVVSAPPLIGRRLRPTLR
jgi:Cd(II)/Pb(II)-responsive transcriptional regulator